MAYCLLYTGCMDSLLFSGDSTGKKCRDPGTKQALAKNITLPSDIY